MCLGEDSVITGGDDLWKDVGKASQAAELYALVVHTGDRFRGFDFFPRGGFGTIYKIEAST